jgi:hypothetical protein
MFFIRDFFVMQMTHYMELLASDQPWNLILFMAIPVVLAETVAIAELAILSLRAECPAWVRILSRVAGIIGGIYFLGVFVYLMTTAVVPLTLSGGWRGPADMIAVGFYLLGVFPLLAIAGLDLWQPASSRGEERRMRLHAAAVAVFLVVAHIAMIFGMLSPDVLGYQAPDASMPAADMNMNMDMSGHDMSSM